MTQIQVNIAEKSEGIEFRKETKNLLTITVCHYLLTILVTELENCNDDVITIASYHNSERIDVPEMFIKM